MYIPAEPEDWAWALHLAETRCAYHRAKPYGKKENKTPEVNLRDQLLGAAPEIILLNQCIKQLSGAQNAAEQTVGKLFNARKTDKDPDFIFWDQDVKWSIDFKGIGCFPWTRSVHISAEKHEAIASAFTYYVFLAAPFWSSMTCASRLVPCAEVARWDRKKGPRNEYYSIGQERFAEKWMPKGFDPARLARKPVVDWERLLELVGSEDRYVPAFAKTYPGVEIVVPEAREAVLVRGYGREVG